MGRINRTYFWLFAAAGTAFGLLLNYALGWQGNSGFGAAMAIIAMPRLHDIGRSGGWVVLPFVVGFVLIGAMVAGLISDAALDTIYPFFAGAIVIAFVILGLIPGHPGANAYGEPFSRNPRRHPN